MRRWGIQITILFGCLIVMSIISGCLEQENTEENHPPLADFSYENQGLIIRFQDLSSDQDGDDLEYVWKFGDGTSAMTQHPIHTYPTGGTYTVSLYVYDGIATDEIQKTLVIINDSSSTLAFACWNLQVFGQTKASNDSLLSYYAEKLSEYDLFILQEIRDKSGSAIPKLANKLPQYQYVISERAGRTASKEQYAIFYNPHITLLGFVDWTDEKQAEFERPPFQATFTTYNWSFSIYTIHMKPDDVSQEMRNLEEMIGNSPGDTIIIGDLNADGTYYDENTKIHFTEWEWVITNAMDTTVAASDNTYDRIIINQPAVNNFLSAGIMDDVEKEQSDHYLIYAHFNPHIH